MAGLLVAGCGDEPHPPPRPPLVLQPRADELEAIARGAPAEAAAEGDRELHDLVDAAFLPGVATPRLAASAKRTLLEHSSAARALEGALGHDDATVRSHAAYELGLRGAQSAQLPLLHRLRYETDDGVRIWLASALAQLGNDAALPVLIEAMDDGQLAPVAGARAIERCRAAGVPLADEPTYASLRAELARLHRHWVEHGHPGTDPAVLQEDTAGRIAQRLLGLRAFQLRGVDEARYVLARLGTLPLPLLRTALSAEERYLRVHALEIVSTIGHPARPLADAVLPLLDDPLAKGQAAQCLGALGATRAIPHLRALLETPDVELRAAAAGALGPLGDRASAPALQGLLDDERQPMDVRVMAAFSLGWFELDRPALGFLRDLEQRDGYHAPTLRALIDALDAASRR